MNAKRPEFSVIIPFREADDYLLECMEHLLKQDSRSFEIVLLPDAGISKRFDKTRVFPTGPVKPSLKRNLGVKKSRGRFLAFIDSDAYPEKDWLRKAAECLKEGNAGIVGGPNLVPESDSIMQKAGDDILSSPIGSGTMSVRYRLSKKKEVAELPSCNMFISKSLFNRLGGFDTSLLTAEDAKLCFQARNAGKKVVYCPDVVVYHHRRPLFRPYLKQIWIYGRDKARVLKAFSPSGKPLYFLPSLFLLYLLSGLALMLSGVPGTGMLVFLFQLSVALYLVLVLSASLLKSPKRSPLIFTGIILTHLTYGLSFLLERIRPGTNQKEQGRAGRPASNPSPSFYARMMHTREFLPENCDVLEVGSGKGYVSEMLVERGCKVTGFDINEASLRMIRAKGRFSVSDIYSYKPGKRFDCIVCLEVLEHLEDDLKALRIMYGWLKPGGRLVLSVPTLEFRENHKDMGHFRHYTDTGKLERMIESCGFSISRKKEWGTIIRRLVFNRMEQTDAVRERNDHALLKRIIRPLMWLDSRLSLVKDGIIIECVKKESRR